VSARVDCLISLSSDSNKKGASRISGRACLICFDFQTSKLEGVNPAKF
jgi:hypothetical protein